MSEIRDSAIREMNGKPAVNLRYLGEYLVMLEGEKLDRDVEVDKKFQQLMDEVVRLSVKCNQLEVRIGGLKKLRKMDMDSKVGNNNLQSVKDSDVIVE